MAEETTVSQPQTPRGSSLLSALGLDAEQVMAAPNVASTLGGGVAPTSDALGIFTAQDEAAGIPMLTEAWQTAQKNFLEGQNLANQQQLTIEGRRKKLGVMRGEQAQAGAQANLDLQTLQTAQTLAQNALSTAQATSAQRAGILYDEYQTKVNLQLQFPGLDIDPLEDDFNKVSEKLEEYQEQIAKDQEKDGYKDALRAMGLSTKGSRGELEDRLTNANAEAAAMVKRKNELQMQSLELSVANAQKSFNAPSIDEQLNTVWGDDSDTVSEVGDALYNLGYGDQSNPFTSSNTVNDANSRWYSEGTGGLS